MATTDKEVTDMDTYPMNVPPQRVCTSNAPFVEGIIQPMSVGI